MSADAPSVPSDPRALADDAVALVREWLARADHGRRHRDAAAGRLATVLRDPHGLEFTVGFVDRVVRTEDVRAAAHALHALAEIVPHALSPADRAQIRAGAVLARTAPQVVVPAARARLRALVGHLIVDARPKPFGQTVRRLRAQGHRLNINLLGEEVLGATEADKHLADTTALLARDDVDYVSLKVSSVVPQLSHWGFEATAAQVVERLLPVYRAAAAAPGGPKFINLDMEVYSDLHLTVEVFTRLLGRPELRDVEAGIVVQAYLPDALAVVQRLSGWAAERVAAGGAGIKVRLVKGANLPMERVDAELHGWPLATWPTKRETDTNYKRVLDWLFAPARMTGLRLGVAGHNLFDIAFAHLLAERRGVTGRIEFEMLQGMAVEQARAVGADVGDLLLYVPAVRPAEFDVAVSYLVRRLEENASPENFMSGIFALAPGNEVFRREEQRFRAALEELVPDGDAPVPFRLQDRSAPGAGSVHLPLDEPFRNEPDTDVSVPANHEWAARIAARIADPSWFEALPVPDPTGPADVERVVATGRAAAEEWRARGARARAEILNRAADVLAGRRAHLLAVAGAEAGKTLDQGDPEVSEAMDFCRYYARRTLELEEVDGARFVPDRLVLVTPPWNFPLAIPTGSTVAALAAGAAVVHKPAPETRRCSTAVVEALWEAGVPRDVLQLVDAVEGETGRALVAHPGVDRVVLTGAYGTARMFSSWRAGRPLTAETSGKNALVITPSADRDRAVWDLVTSAFGHAGQKCSAASLGILVGSVATSPRFHRQLLDAASSLVVDWPQNLQAKVGPVIAEPGDKLRRALTGLDAGERWLLEPEPLDGTGRLWRPGIKTGVAPGSFFHRTECFGPVLGLMAARDLPEALELQNAVDYGLTAGLHSLDPEEISTWADLVQAGNLYVNRSVTGAIVQRQPFGGWKRSSVGLGAKAGGPNYLAQLGTWEKAPFDEHAGTGARPANELLQRLDELRPLVPGPDHSWLTACAQQDQAWWEQEFGRAHDPTGLEQEANVFRYRPRDVVVRAAEDAPLTDVIRVGLAAERSGSRVVLVPAVELPGEVRELFRAVLDPCSDETFARVAADWADPSGAGRIRVVGTAPGLAEALADRPEIALLAGPVVGASRVEMLPMLAEQSVTVTMHRFGNPSPDAETVVRHLIAATPPMGAPVPSPET